MKRIFAFFLTIALLLPLAAGAVPSAGAAEDTWESEVHQQLNAYISSLGKPNASGARNRLINHALNGKGAYLSMGETDVFSVAILNTNLMQACLEDTLVEAVLYALYNKQDTLYIGGSTNWYDDRMAYGSGVYPEPVENEEIFHKDRISTLCSQSTEKGWTLNKNACDDVMVGVVGNAAVRITLKKTASTLESITWHVDLQIKDDFDFNSGFNASNLIGSLLTGSLIETYSWGVSAEFSFTVTNTCIHETGIYRWEADGDALYPVEGQGLTVNLLERLASLNADGSTRNVYFSTEKLIDLNHDRPWVVEFRMACNSSLILSELSYISDSDEVHPYLLKTSRYIGGGYRADTEETDPKTGKMTTVYALQTDYSCIYEEKGYSGTEVYTFRLENRVTEDGSNMVWLSINGTEVGPLNERKYTEYVSKTELSNAENAIVDWFNGQDICIHYLFNGSYGFKPECQLEYIQIWENGEGNEPLSHFETAAIAPTCEEAGKIVYTCSLCGASYSEETGEAALGHDWDSETITTVPVCTEEGVLTYICANDPSHTKTEAILATGHTPVADSAVTPTCTANGLTEGKHCEICGDVLTEQETVPATGHNWDEGVEVIRPSVSGSGMMHYTCTICGEIRTEEIPYDPQTTRIAGDNRFETAFLTADQMKRNLGIEKFDAVVVASGTNFADALSGSYLAAVKEAPILLACNVEWINQLVKDYISENLNPGGTVYILGGESAVPASFETGLEGFQLDRLAGGNRFETNLLVLEEAGIGDNPILVATGLTFADSLSASAAKLPILLVYGDKLLPDQAAFLEANQGRDLYILGGEGAVGSEMEAVLTAYGTVERVAGNNRFETSVKIAEKFFAAPESAVLAYAWDFPDGLCGGALAATMNAALILTMTNYETQAAEYIQSEAIRTATILGGEAFISENAVAKIFNIQ